MPPFLAEAPGGDTLLDVHPTLLKVQCKGCIPPNPIFLEGDEGRAKRCISAHSVRDPLGDGWSEDGGAPRRGPAFISSRIFQKSVICGIILICHDYS